MSNFKPVILKDSNGNPLYTVTHAKGVYVNSNKTLDVELQEIKSSISSGGSGGGNLPEGVVSLNNIQHVALVKAATGNLFNKDTVELNGYWNSQSWYKDAEYVSSAPIPVTSGKKYTVTSGASGLTGFWNNNTFVSKASNHNSFTVPANVTHVRLAIRHKNHMTNDIITNLDTLMMVEGETLPSSYVPFGPTNEYGVSGYSLNVEPKRKSINSHHFSDEAVSFVKSPTEAERLERARGKVNLFIETEYIGYNQPIHPSVHAFSTPWNGYKYWMGYTPFPYALDITENPGIAVSNDLLYWTTPTGYTNPLDDLSDGQTTYFSDTHLVYRPDLNRLECWYNRNDKNDATLGGYYRKYTTDGVNWSARERMMPNGTSPAVLWDNVRKIYQIFLFYTNGHTGQHNTNAGYWELTEDKVLTKISNYIYESKSVLMPSWHGDVVKTPRGYEMVVQPKTNDNDVILHYVSDDGITWREKKELVKWNKHFGLDAKGFYRPNLLYHNNHYYLFNSTITPSGERGITLSYSTEENNILSLKGIDAEHLTFMNAPTKKPRGGYVGQVVFDNTLNKAIICTTGGRYAVWKDFNGNIV